MDQHSLNKQTTTKNEFLTPEAICQIKRMLDEKNRKRRN